MCSAFHFEVTAFVRYIRLDDYKMAMCGVFGLEWILKLLVLNCFVFSDVLLRRCAQWSRN